MLTYIGKHTLRHTLTQMHIYTPIFTQGHTVTQTHRLSYMVAVTHKTTYAHSFMLRYLYSHTLKPHSLRHTFTHLHSHTHTQILTFTPSPPQHTCNTHIHARTVAHPSDVMHARTRSLRTDRNSAQTSSPPAPHGCLGFSDATSSPKGLGCMGTGV